MEPRQERVFYWPLTTVVAFLENEFLTRDLNDMVIYRSALPHWCGQSMAQLFARYQLWQMNNEAVDDAEEARAFAAMGGGYSRRWRILLALLQHFDRDLHWHYVAANKDPEVVKQLILHLPNCYLALTTAVHMSPTWRFLTAICVP